MRPAYVIFSASLLACGSGATDLATPQRCNPLGGSSCMTPWPSAIYEVAIKKTLKAKGGGELPIPEGFQAILDGTDTSHTLLEAVRPRYVDIFAALAAHGIDKSDVVTAWDFTTASRESVRADLLNA